MVNGRTSKRVRSVKESLIKSMSSEGKETISLAQGVPKIKTPREIRSTLVDLSSQDTSFRYTAQTGLSELRELIAQRLENKTRKKVVADNIIITSGAISGLMCVFLSILDKGDEAILLSPTYPSYIEQIQLSGGKPVMVALEEGGRICMDKLKVKITERTKCVVVCSPSNPTGLMLSREELNGLANVCKEKGLFLVSDETYKDLVYDKPQGRDVLPIGQENIISVYSFSKNIAISGLRLGFVCAGQELVKDISKANDALAICAPSISQYLVLELIRKQKIEKLSSKLRKEMKSRRDLICKRLDNLSFFFSYTKPEGAIFVFPKLPDCEDDIKFCEEMRKEAKVTAVPGSAFGAKGYVRMSFGCTEEEINEAFERIGKFIEKRQK